MVSFSCFYLFLSHCLSHNVHANREDFLMFLEKCGLSDSPVLSEHLLFEGEY